MSTTTPDPYPEHTRQTEILGDADAIGQFIESTEYVLAEYRTFDDDDRGPQLVPVATPIVQILAAHFGIDLAKIETEKRAMLALMNAAGVDPL